MSGREAWPSSREVFDVEVLSCSFLLALLDGLRALGSFGQYPAPYLSFLCASHSSLVQDIQLISECRRSASLRIGRVLSSPQEFPIDILLSLIGRALGR